MSVLGLTGLVQQLHDFQKAVFETNSKEKWLLLQTCWNRYSNSELALVLEAAEIATEPKPLEFFEHREKRKIAQAVRDIRFFNWLDQALNGRDLRLWQSLSREFPVLENDRKDKWLLLQVCWNRYPKEQRDFVLSLTGIKHESTPFACFDEGQKRQISLAIRRLRWFGKSDRALNGEELRRYEQLSRGN